MKYSESLIKEVKELYPDYKEMHKLADEGGIYLGRYLCDSQTDAMPLKQILEATSLVELQNKAILQQRKVDLYIKWGKEDPRCIK